jgi:hypothetical protein
MSKSITVKALALSMVLLLSLAAFGKEKKVESGWAEKPPQLNGVDDEWKEIVLNNEKKVAVDYAFTNDSQYLYVLFKFQDPKYLSSIQMTGMTLWYHTEGKKKKDHGVNFGQKQFTSEEYIAYVESQQGSLPEEKKTELRQNPAYIVPFVEVINKKVKSATQSEPGSDALPARYMVSTQGTVITFEIALPLAKPEATAPGIGTEAGKLIKLGFMWGGVTDEMKEEWMRTGTVQGGAMGGTSDSRGSGVANADFSGGRGSGLTALKKRFKEYSFWVDLQLAKAVD